MTREIKQWRLYSKPSKKNTATILSRSLIHGYGKYEYYGYRKKNSVYDDDYGVYYFYLIDDGYIKHGATRPYYSSYMKNGITNTGFHYSIDTDIYIIRQLKYRL